MKQFEPQILTDKSRLQEIYDLRVLAYEHSPKAEYVNRVRFPNGWKDDLDEKEETIHWVIEDNNKIIGSARLAIINSIEQTELKQSNIKLPVEKPFAYWSRLVIHPDYRQSNVMMKLDWARKSYLLNNSEIKFAICWASPERCNAIKRLGFVHIQDIQYNWGGEFNNSQSFYIFQKLKSNMRHNHLSFWGRTLDDYRNMFNLEPASDIKVLSVADGPSTFNLEARTLGMQVVSIDPVYGMNEEVIRSYFNESYEYNKTLFIENRALFCINSESDIENLLQKRTDTFQRWFDDFKEHSECYLDNKLPYLIGFKDHYDLCLCSNFLFLFGHLFDLDFHIASIKEMLRLAKEVRIFPIYDIDGKQSQYLTNVIDFFSKTCIVTIENVNYEVYRNGNKMLRMTPKIVNEQ